MKRKGIARLLCVFVLCGLFLWANIYGKVFSQTEFITDNPSISTEESLVFWEDSIFSTDDNSENISSSDKTTSNESVVTGGGANVAGKIITRYISPYNAAISYNKVYMKNSSTKTVNVKNLLNSSLSFKLKKNNEPQVLIMHTHTTETFMDKESDTYSTAFNSRSRDKQKNMVRIGQIVSEKLNNVGIKTLHDTTEHDYPKYTGSYGRAATTINKYLKKYPSIKIVLDLHRDAVSSGESDKAKLVTEIKGKKAAQVMLVMGAECGENWQENLKLAVRVQQKLESKYPTLARPLSLMPKSYNQGLTRGSLLIEFGTDVNTLAEAEYSAELVGNALGELFNTLT